MMIHVRTDLQTSLIITCSARHTRNRSKLKKMTSKCPSRFSTSFNTGSTTWFGLVVLLWLSFIFIIVPRLHAQEQEAEPETANANGQAHLFITDSNGQNAPTVQLRLYGQSLGGEPLDFGQTPLSILHNDTAVDSTAITVVGQEEVGTLTIFLVDNPPGVQQQQADIQAAIQQYASQAHMREGVDYVAVYKVGLNGIIEFLAPTQFYNSVTNLFVDPLPVQNGATALIDSTYQLLNQIETIKPQPELAPHIVVLSDGTDAVSTQTEPDLFATAGQIGVPVHTIWLTNSNLATPTAGQGFMQELARVSNGLATSMDNSAGVTRILERIDSFRMQTRLSYLIPAVALDAGQFAVTVALRDNTAVQAITTVTITAERPLVTIDVPPSERTLILPSLDTPTTLSFPVSVAWLGNEASPPTVAQAQLLVNGQPQMDIPPAQLTRFTTAVSNLTYGPNRIQVALVDSTGQPGLGEILLTVNQGDTAVIPAVLQPAGFSLTDISSGWGNVLLGCLFALLAVGALLFLAYTLRDWPLAQQIGLDKLFANLPRPRRRRRRGTTVTVTDAPEATTGGTPVVPASRGGGASLEVLEAVTNVASPWPLRQVEIRLGRAPIESDLCFEQDMSVSRIHASLILEGNSYRVFDEQSTSGTFVNGQPVPDYGTLLFDGDELTLGAVRLRYRAN